jgi:hypothetical protein
MTIFRSKYAWRKLKKPGNRLDSRAFYLSHHPFASGHY